MPSWKMETNTQTLIFKWKPTQVSTSVLAFGRWHMFCGRELWHGFVNNSLCFYDFLCWTVLFKISIQVVWWTLNYLRIETSFDADPFWTTLLQSGGQGEYSISFNSIHDNIVVQPSQAEGEQRPHTKRSQRDVSFTT